MVAGLLRVRISHMHEGVSRIASVLATAYTPYSACHVCMYTKPPHLEFVSLIQSSQRNFLILLAMFLSFSYIISSVSVAARAYFPRPVAQFILRYSIFVPVLAKGGCLPSYAEYVPHTGLCRCSSAVLKVLSSMGSIGSNLGLGVGYPNPTHVKCIFIFLDT
ncbi:hypothetical protein F4777DRAFT_516903 [Nemania sp. FL0916]|nr:hypothetical protein F4777DRAFT_516903 [Nemania sp. FL0916]